MMARAPHPRASWAAPAAPRDPSIAFVNTTVLGRSASTRDEVWALAQELGSSYAADALLSSPALIGSLDMLGNPTGLLREYAIGMRDMVLLPLSAVTEGKYGGGVQGVLRGVAHGGSSLVRHVVGGTLASVAGFSDTVARNLDANRAELAASRQRFAELKHERQLALYEAWVPPASACSMRSRAASGSTALTGQITGFQAE